MITHSSPVTTQQQQEIPHIHQVTDLGQVKATEQTDEPTN
jgi:hypothetical protein